MVYARISTAEQLLALLPRHLKDLKEAEELLADLQDESQDLTPEEVISYPSLYDAFEDLYPGTVDQFQEETCESLERCITDFHRYYADWLFDNTAYYCELSSGKTIIIRN